MRLCVAILALVMTGAVRADSTVVFNEIMYHSESNDEEMEWLELHNQMAVDMDLTGWSIQGGIDYQFPHGLVLAGGGYLVVAKSPETIQAATGITNVVGPFQRRLSNSGERLELRNNNNRLMDRARYRSGGDGGLALSGGGHPGSGQSIRVPG